MSELAIEWPVQDNEHGEQMLWFGSWLVGGAGDESAWFYSGRGGAQERYAPPASATGVRIRRWPNEGFDAEYVDVLDLAATRALRPAELDFDRPQPYSLLEKGVE
jgi:hypothetical protein